LDILFIESYTSICDSGRGYDVISLLAVEVDSPEQHAKVLELYREKFAESVGLCAFVVPNAFNVNEVNFSRILW
jgi:hypothetical protein